MQRERIEGNEPKAAIHSFLTVHPRDTHGLAWMLLFGDRQASSRALLADRVAGDGSGWRSVTRQGAGRIRYVF